MWKLKSIRDLILVHSFSIELEKCLNSNITNFLLQSSIIISFQIQIYFYSLYSPLLLFNLKFIVRFLFLKRRLQSSIIVAFQILIYFYPSYSSLILLNLKFIICFLFFNRIDILRTFVVYKVL